MRVLLACHRLPYPPNHGGRIRAYQLLRHLARRHQVSVVALLRRDDPSAAVVELRRWCDHVVTVPAEHVTAPLRAAWNVVRGRPASFAYFAAPRLQRVMDDLMRELRFDLAIAHSSSMAPYLERYTLPTILDFCDMDSQKWLAFSAVRTGLASSVFALESRLLAREESRLARGSDAITVATPGEWRDAQRICGAVRGGYFPIGVDCEEFAPGDASPEQDSVCFLGRMNYFPNADAVRGFVRGVWPIVLRRRPGARFTIIGADPPTGIRALHGRDGIVVTGAVDDVRPIALRSAVAVTPMRVARGTQNKILESMAMELPVVATSAAAQGVDAVAGEHLLVADDPAAFAEAVVSLLSDEAARRALAGAGRQRILSHHDAATCLNGLDSLIEEICARRTLR